MEEKTETKMEDKWWEILELGEATACQGGLSEVTPVQRFDAGAHHADLGEDSFRQKAQTSKSPEVARKGGGRRSQKLTMVAHIGFASRTEDRVYPVKWYVTPKGSA